MEAQLACPKNKKRTKAGRQACVGSTMPLSGPRAARALPRTPAPRLPAMPTHLQPFLPSPLSMQACSCLRLPWRTSSRPFTW